MSKAPIFSVSEINRQARSHLEDGFPMIGVNGEISNLTQAASGHCYFSLKDNKAQLRCAFFTGYKKQNSDALKNGQQILAFGKLSLYEPRGDYQLIVSFVQDSGQGLLYQEFIALKNRLQASGLFDPQHKKPLPKYPQEIAIITSAHGAAIHDILSTLKRRYPLCRTKLYACEVQGEKAPAQIMQALNQAIHDKTADCIILARGGGSIEDLWAFNHEELAHRIYACPIPIITGIGHETDFSIADFVADFRAATPTAAAEKVSPDQFELMAHIQHLQNNLYQWLQAKLQQKSQKLDWCLVQLRQPYQRLNAYWQRYDYSRRLLQEKMQQVLKQQNAHLSILERHLKLHNPQAKLSQQQEHLTQIELRLTQNIKQYFKRHLEKQMALQSRLEALGPSATLNRGYAIAMHQGQIIFNTQDLQIGDTVEVSLAQGTFLSKVLECKEDCSWKS